MRKFVLSCAAALTLAGPVAAQDFFMAGSSPMDLAPQSQALTSSVIGNLSVGDTARRSGGGGGGMAVGQRGGGVGNAMGFGPGGRVSDARLPFTTNAGTQRKAYAEYMARVKQKNPAAYADGSRALAGINIHQRFADMARPVGLRADDAADVMTAFLIAGWEMMNGREAPPAAVRGVRRQVAGQLTTVPQMRNPAVRTAFGEELKIQTFVLGSGYATARREGGASQSAYRQGVSRFYRRITGRDISGWQLTSGGFRR